jgi:hypothetical protein
MRIPACLAVSCGLALCGFLSASVSPERPDKPMYTYVSQPSLVVGGTGSCRVSREPYDYTCNITNKDGCTKVSCDTVGDDCSDPKIEVQNAEGWSDPCEYAEEGKNDCSSTTISCRMKQTCGKCEFDQKRNGIFCTLTTQISSTAHTHYKATGEDCP